jgi:hypothetical protein
MSLDNYLFPRAWIPNVLVSDRLLAICLHVSKASSRNYILHKLHVAVPVNDILYTLPVTVPVNINYRYSTERSIFCANHVNVASPK